MSKEFCVELQVDREYHYVIALKNIQLLISSAPSNTMYYDDRDGFVCQKYMAKKYFFKFSAKHDAKKIYTLLTEKGAVFSMDRESGWSERVAP